MVRPFRVGFSLSGFEAVGAPSLRFLQGRVRCCRYHKLFMPSGLHRSYGAHHLHFITCSCYRRLPLLNSARARDRFLSVLEQTRQRYRFVVVGYVVMPEHVHLLLSEPEVGDPSTVMQVVKQRTAHALEQLSTLFVGRSWVSASERRMGKDFVRRQSGLGFFSKIPCRRQHRTRPSQTARRAGQPQLWLCRQDQRPGHSPNQTQMVVHHLQ